MARRVQSIGSYLDSGIVYLIRIETGIFLFRKFSSVYQICQVPQDDSIDCKVENLKVELEVSNADDIACYLLDYESIFPIHWEDRISWGYRYFYNLLKDRKDSISA